MLKEPGSQPRILVINDDEFLLKSRRMLLESVGAQVFIACGTKEAIREILLDPVDLVLIDLTNVGLEHGKALSKIVKGIHPSQMVALLVKSETQLPSDIEADHVIRRSGPRQMLVTINELLDGRLNLDLWRHRYKYEETPSSF